MLRQNPNKGDHYAVNKPTSSQKALVKAMLALGMMSSTHLVYAQVIEEISVTGSRVVRDGYSAPTPVTALSSDWLMQNSATVNLADTLSTLPVFANNAQPATAVSGASAATQGLNVLNLRGMGGNRTLTLLDGQRSVPSLLSGEVDINNFPQQLVERVETVTGGASAVYGSDAVAGVVNLILNRNFTGFKSEFSVGETNYGDDASSKVAISFGTPFADGRGHLLLSGETATRDGVTPNNGRRDWNKGGEGIIQNPNYVPGNGLPQFLVLSEVALRNATHGGIINDGPLRGTAFGPGGQPYQMNYGSIQSGPWMSGGAWRDNEIRNEFAGTLEPENERTNLFARVSYDVTDSTNVFLQVAAGDNRTQTAMWPHFQAGNGPTILSGNPFIPASVQAVMDQQGLASFRIGSMNTDLGIVGTDVNRESKRFVIGADGKIDMFARSWVWNAYVQDGTTDSDTDITNVLQTARYAQAVDAVRHPVTGNIVCRSTLSNPGNGCIPFNPLGTNVSTPEARAWVTGVTSLYQTIEQRVYAGSIAGDIYENWAGPVSIALSAEYRKDEAKATVSGGGPWFAGNFQGFDESTAVKEAAVEAVIPLLQGAAFAESLDLSLAGRITDYDSTGRVETWKIGAVWDLNSMVRFRATSSLDIRAPNFNELFATSNSGQRSAFDPFTNTTPQFFGGTSGNLDLQPEEGRTREVGVVLRPDNFLPGFSVSLDWWEIELAGAINRPNDNQTLQFCYEGRQEFCNRIQRDQSGVITLLTQVPFNIASQVKEGIDLDMSQSFDVGAGTIGLRGLATYYMTSTQDDGLGAGSFTTLGNKGQFNNGPPRWRTTINANYSLAGLVASLTYRAQSRTYINPTYIECSQSCPVSVSGAQTINDNDISSAYYLDASLSYTMDVAKTQVQAFVNIRNLLDKDPKIVPQGPTDFTYVQALSRPASGFDVLGRQYLAGVRVSF
jgi:iron complex outermembrane recepter protein